MLFSEITSNSVHEVTLCLKDDKPWALRPLSMKTQFNFSGKIFVQNSFDSRNKEEFLTVEVVHEANHESVSLLLHKSRFKVETNFEFEGEATVYLLKPSESTPDDCTTPPRKMSMTSNRSVEDPARPSISIYQNCFPINSVLSALRENFTEPLSHSMDGAKGAAAVVAVHKEIEIIPGASSALELHHGQRHNKRSPGEDLNKHKNGQLITTSMASSNHGNGVHGDGSSYGFYHPPQPGVVGRQRGRLELKLLFQLQYKYTIYQGKEGKFYKPSSIQMTPFALSFKNMLEQAIHSDVTLEVENSVFPAHMAVLAAQSEVFRAMFASNMLEKKTKRVIIHDMSATCVKEMLNFLYTRETTNFEQNIDLAIEMLHAAEKYFIADLQDASIQALKAFSESNLHHLEHQKHLRHFLKSIVKF